ncbi:helix-turn-helix domain-containing protein [Chromobacterium violaceum]|uniref:helix-turn-helix domain-containing protein n=1 Tax=Chromobacterium violaceum TaxID=536 RepID=UPI00143DD140|nr:helix-turn-helix domain-containing protein [Chromobacterium violaceum]QIY78366.1 helix-turn-helix domain-containing protein [Chromobacterium violaceum]
MKETLNLDEAAELMNIGTETARELADIGVLPGCKVGVAWVFLRDDVLGYLRDEVRRQTNQRIAKAEAEKTLGIQEKYPRVKTAVSRSGARGTRKGKLPNLDELEN